MERKGFIGGSDTVQIMQGNWHDLWLVKTGRAEPEDLSRVLPVQLGIWTEAFNISWFETELNKEVVNRQATYEAIIGNVPVKATIDGIIQSEGIIECKHSNAFTNMNDQLDYYMPQIQTYIHAAAQPGAWVSILFGNMKWEAIYVAADGAYMDKMWAVVSDFWGHVVRDEEPPVANVEKISIDAIPVDQMVRRDASTSNEFAHAAAIYIENQDAAKLFEGAKKDLKAQVGANEREVYNAHLIVARDKRGALRIKVR